MPKIDIEHAPVKRGSDYPLALAASTADRVARLVSEAGGLSDFVATHVTVPPGGCSSLRHWHEREDEVVVVLAGEAVLIDDDGRHPMRAGDVATFRKGQANAHHVRNESDSPCVLFAVSLPERSPVHYPDVAMRWHPERGYETASQPDEDGAH